MGLVQVSENEFVMKDTQDSVGYHELEDTLNAAFFISPSDYKLQFSKVNDILTLKRIVVEEHMDVDITKTYKDRFKRCRIQQILHRPQEVLPYSCCFGNGFM